MTELRTIDPVASRRKKHESKLPQPKIGKLYDKAMFLRVACGTATADDGTVYDVSTSTVGSPLVYSNKSKRFFSLSWQDIVQLAIEAGIDA